MIATQTVSRENTNASGATSIIYVPLERILDNPYQPRLDYEPEGIEDLAAGIFALKESLSDTLGLQQIPVARFVQQRGGEPVSPIHYHKLLGGQDIVRVLDRDLVTVQLHFGHRRLRAFRLLAERDADYGSMPVRIAYADELQMWQHAATENARRAGLNAIERARSMQAAMTDFGLSLDEAAEPYGYSRSAASNSVRLLKLPAEVQKAVARGELSEKHARTLLRLEAAPDMLIRMFEQAQNEEWSTRRLDDAITARIENCKPVPDTPTVETFQYFEGGPLNKRTIGTPWTMDFGPDTSGWEDLDANRRFAVVGACAGCPLRVTFSGASYPRCTKHACYEAKDKLWRDYQVDQQRKALLNRAKATYTQEPVTDVTPSKPTQADPSMTVDDVATLIRQALAERNDCPDLEAYRGSSWSIFLADNYARWPTIDTTRQAIKEVQRKPSQAEDVTPVTAEPAGTQYARSSADWSFEEVDGLWRGRNLSTGQRTPMWYKTLQEADAAAAEMESSTADVDEQPVTPEPIGLPADRIIDAGLVGSPAVDFFGQYNAKKNLVEQGLCSAERCECFVLTYKSHITGDELRPDPENAPNMCYGCTSTARRGSRAREAEKQASHDGLTKKQRAKAQAQADRERIDEAFDELDGPNALWTNPAFLRACFNAINSDLRSELRIDLDGATVADLQRAIFVATAYKAAGEYIYDLGSYDVSHPKVDAFLGRIRNPIQPGPGDSQRTGWEQGWTAEDDAEFERLRSIPFAEWSPKCNRSRVILRALEMATGKETRGALWQHFNYLERSGR